MICGPSNAGKSTLARAIGLKARHAPSSISICSITCRTPTGSARPKKEFEALHDAAIAGEKWVIEGNYFGTIPQRLARATGIILLGSEPWRAAARNVRRTLFETQRRAGQLEGGIDKLSWGFLQFIIFEQPTKRARDQGILRTSGLPMVELGSMRELQGALCGLGTGAVGCCNSVVTDRRDVRPVLTPSLAPHKEWVGCGKITLSVHLPHLAALSRLGAGSCGEAAQLAPQVRSVAGGDGRRYPPATYFTDPSLIAASAVVRIESSPRCILPSSASPLVPAKCFSLPIR